MDRLDRRARWRRFVGWIGLAVRRTRTRAVATAPGRIGASVAGVAIAIALLLVVTGLAVGMIVPATGLGGDEYWVVPADAAESPLVTTGQPQFGEASEAAERMAAVDGVEAASPVLIELASAETADGTSEYVVAVGVRPDAGVDVYGLSPAAIEGADDVVLSTGTASTLGVAVGDSLSLGDRDVTVAGIDDGEGAAVAAPTIVVDVETLQSMTGADEHDAADRFVVVGEPGVEDDLAAIYGDATVRSGTGMAADRLFDADLPFALSLSALLVSLVVGTLFVAVVTAMEVAADRAELATLAAIGVARRRRRGLYAGQSLLVSLAGGVAGVGLGLAAIALVNRTSRAALDATTPVVAHPLLVPYGLGAALAVGCCSIPAVGLVVRRVEAEVGRGG